MFKHFSFWRILLLLVVCFHPSWAKTDDFKHVTYNTIQTHRKGKKLYLTLAFEDTLKKQPVNTLRKENFKIFYVNEPVNILEATGVRSIVIAIDYSGSMKRTVGNKRKIDSAREAVNAYIDSSVGAAVEVGLVAIASSAVEISDFSRNKEVLKSSLDGIRLPPNAMILKNGTKVNTLETALFDGIKLSLKKLESRPGSKVLIVVSDGKDTALENKLKKSLLKGSIDEREEKEENAIAGSASDNEIRVFAIGIGDTSNQAEVNGRSSTRFSAKDTTAQKKLDDRFLKKLSAQTKGFYQYQDITELIKGAAPQQDRLKEGLLGIFRNIGTAIDGEYYFTLAWDNRKDFKWELLEVQLVKTVLERIGEWPLEKTLLVFLVPLLVLFLIPASTTITFDGLWFTLNYVRTFHPNLKIKDDWDETPMHKRLDPIAKRPFQTGERVVICPECKTLHLAESWKANGNCCAARTSCPGYGRPLY